MALVPTNQSATTEPLPVFETIVEAFRYVFNPLPAFLRMAAPLIVGLSVLAVILEARPRSLVADEEWLPFREESFDLVTSCLSLHWVNDLPGALIQINRSLKPDGLFLSALLGGETLHELRTCLFEAEIAVTGGSGPRVSPLTDLRDAGALMQRAGFALPVIDADTITVTYASPFALMQDLRAMGETNAVLDRPKRGLRRDVLMRTAELYGSRHGLPDGRIPATFQVIYMHGWAPHESQPRPMRPGSAKSRLADALDTEEQQTGDHARPQSSSE